MQLSADLHLTLAAGVSGSGKTTFAFRYLVADRKLTARFVFDYRGEASLRLGIPSAENPEEMEFATEDGFCLFYPGTLFPGRLPEAMNFFVKWVFEKCARLPGRKLLVIDEVWKFCSPNKISPELSECIQEGRKFGLEMMFLTQRPNRLNEAILNEVTELVCFKLRGNNALESLEEMGIDRDEIINLPKGEFVAINVERGGRELRGKLW
jgi:DNA helicase HerA-like ATPase